MFEMSIDVALIGAARVNNHFHIGAVNLFQAAECRGRHTVRQGDFSVCHHRMAEGEIFSPFRGFSDTAHRNIKLIGLQIAGKRRPAGQHKGDLKPQLLPQILCHIHVVTAQFARFVVERQRSIVARNAHFQLTALLNRLQIPRLATAGNTREYEGQPAL